ncbi:hypothetical protein CR161_09020 [Prosthecochloris sp. ZM]|uniref:hypothetical protein n=1 Tax=unclassified Prosthecochloris TaxID=2632826 RepID=UPI000DF73CFA|nr:MULTISPECIES: hypothetical protein [unclassified Prosthecochloris]NEX12619.1 hypothetical protein [Prosthecochloris sp.]RDD30826.1 hypothetical protein CR161_09020 [Prosthecochloris sp. ZM]
MKNRTDRKPQQRLVIDMEIRTLISLVSALIFIGLSLYIVFFLAKLPGAVPDELSFIALMTGLYGAVRLWRAILSIRNRQ